MPSFTRHIAALLLVALAVGACAAPQAPAGQTPEPTTGAATGEAPTASTTEGDGAPITISFAAEEFQRQAYEPLIEEFNKQNSDVQVRFIPFSEILGSDGMLNMSTMASQLVRGADTVSAPFVRPEDTAAGLLRDLAPLIEGDPTFDRDDFYAGALGTPGQSGIYAIPQTLRVDLLNYNKELWAIRGLPEPKPDWTWDDLIAAAKQLARKRGDTVETYGLVDLRAADQALAGALAPSSASAGLTSAETAQLDNPAIATALEQVATLAQSGAIYWSGQGGGGPGDFDALQKLIDSGAAAIWPAEMVQRITIGDGPKPEEPPAKPFAVGTVPMPALPLEDFRGGFSYIMSSGTQHPEAAWRWLSFLSKQNVASPFGGLNSLVPARKSLAEKSGYWNRLDAETKTAVEAALEKRATASADALDQQVLETLRQALGAVIGGTPVARALADARAALDKQVGQAQLTPTATPQAPVAVATPAPEVAPPGATPLVFSSFGFGGDIRQLARDFNQEHPDLFVQVKEPGFSGKPLDFADVAATSDCFAWFGPPKPNEITATLDLQPLFDADPSFKLDDYPALLLEPFRHDGRLAGLPDQVSLRTLTYSKAAFEAAGLDTPQASWTVDQFLDAAQKLTSGNQQDQRYGFASITSSAEDLLFFLRLQGVAATRGSGTALEPNFTDPQLNQAVRAYLDLLKQNSPHDQLTGYTRDMTIGESFKLISEGRVGMWFDYSGGGRGLFMVRAGTDNSASSAEQDQKIAPPPFGTAPASADDASANGVYISASTPNAAGCWKWLKYLSGAASRFKSSFPARTSIATSDAFLGQARPGAAEVYAAYSDLLKRQDQATANQPIDYFWFFRAVDRALQGGNLDGDLAEAQSLTEQYLACVKAGSNANTCATQIDPQYQGIGAR